MKECQSAIKEHATAIVLHTRTTADLRSGCSTTGCLMAVAGHRAAACAGIINRGAVVAASSALRLECSIAAWRPQPAPPALAAAAGRAWHRPRLVLGRAIAVCVGGGPGVCVCAVMEVGIVTKVQHIIGLRTNKGAGPAAGVDLASVTPRCRDSAGKLGVGRWPRHTSSDTLDGGTALSSCCRVLCLSSLHSALIRSHASTYQEPACTQGGPRKALHDGKGACTGPGSMHACVPLGRGPTSGSQKRQQRWHDTCQHQPPCGRHGGHIAGSARPGSRKPPRPCNPIPTPPRTHMYRLWLRHPGRMHAPYESQQQRRPWEAAAHSP